MTRLAEYIDRRELFLNLVLRELKGRYKKSVLGWTWSLLNPLSSVVVYYVVFKVLLKVQPPTGHPSGLNVFVIFLLCALIPWNFIANSMTLSLEAFVGNANLIKKVYFPRELLVASLIGSLVVTMLIELSVLCVVLLIFGNMVIPWIPAALVLVALQAVFMLGVGLVLASANVYFRDVRHFIGIAMQVLFYSAPIVYPINLVPKTTHVAGVSVPVGFLYRLNPLVQFVQTFRNVLYDLRFPPFVSVLYMLGWAVGMLALGLWVFGRLDPRIAEEV